MDFENFTLPSSKRTLMDFENFTVPSSKGNLMDFETEGKHHRVQNEA